MAISIWDTLSSTKGYQALKEKIGGTIFGHRAFMTDSAYKKQRRVVGPRVTRGTKVTRNVRSHFYLDVVPMATKAL